MKKKLSFILLAIMIALLSVFCTSCSDKDDGVLKVGMECGYQPYNWTQQDDANGAVPIYGKRGLYANGYDVQIAKKLAESLGMKLEIHAYKWDSLIPSVMSGSLDLIIAGMSPTDKRKEKIDFSDAYYESNLVVVVRKDGGYANATKISELSGARIVAQAGTFHDEVVDQIPNVKHQTALEDFPTMITALNSKTIDGYIAEEPGAKADCNANPNFIYLPFKNNGAEGTGFKVEDMSNVTLAVGLKKHSKLLSGVNEALKNISNDERDALMLDSILSAKNLAIEVDDE